MPASFNKPATSIPEQIALLGKRGLIIQDNAAAEHFLKHIGYYRLAGYWQIFQNDKVNHIFIPGTALEQIVNLYNFSESALGTILIDVRKELGRSNEDFVTHHKRKYEGDEYPPAWMTMQVLTFGTLSKIYGNMRNDIPEKREMAKVYALPTEVWLHSWMQVVSVLRNHCAHHSRLCYRVFSFPPKDMHRPKLPWIRNIPPAGGKVSQHLYYQLCAVRYLLQTCSPGNQFNDKLRQLITRYPKVELNRMGFIPDWESEDLWQLL